MVLYREFIRPVNATAPCTVNASATVTVTVQAAPNAGTNGVLTVCAGHTPTTTELFNAFGGSPDAGGTWSGSVSGVYTYTVNATAPCTVNASATVTVTIQAAPNAGTNGTLMICDGHTPSNSELFAALGGSPDASGTWSGSLSGVYTYTVTATAPCTVNASATVTITSGNTAAPTGNATQTFCNATTGPVTTQCVPLTNVVDMVENPSCSWTDPRVSITAMEQAVLMLRRELLLTWKLLIMEQQPMKLQ